jgi:type VI secretion system secreted protein VgrG
MGIADTIGAISGGIIQSGRLLKLDTPLGDNVLLPQRVIAHSRLSRDYAFTVDVVTSTATIELKTLIAQPVTLWIQQSDASYLPHHGYVHTARRLGADGALISYQLGFASWLHFLKFRKDARIWQDQPADHILTDVFNMHPRARGAFRFALSQALPPRSFCKQYENDWHFVQRLMENEGLFSYFEQAADGKSHTLVVTDNLDACPALAPQAVPFYRAGTHSEANTLLQWSGSRTLQSTSLVSRTNDYKVPASPANPKGTSIPTLGTQGNLPQQAEVYEYTGAYTYAEQGRGDHLSKIRVEEWESRAKRFFDSGGVRRMDAGRWFELDDHPEHDTDSAQNRQFVAIETGWFIENNLPTGSQAVDFPHSLKGQLAAVRASHASAAAGASAASALNVGHADGSDGFFLVEIEAQRKAIPYRSPFEHHKPEMHLQTVTVVGPANQEV